MKTGTEELFTILWICYRTFRQSKVKQLSFISRSDSWINKWKMVSAWVKEKRRFSEQVTLGSDKNDNKKRRQTIGDVSSRNRSPQPDILSTPLKKRISLGTSASYFFSGMSKTPQSVMKSTKKKAESPGPSYKILSNMKDNNKSNFSSPSSSSTASNDAMNKSILSDTTELTASNFVLAATSRQKLAELAKTGKENLNVNGAVPESDSSNKAIDEMSSLTPSPRTLRKLTESLKKDRLNNQEPKTSQNIVDIKSSHTHATFSPTVTTGSPKQISKGKLDKSKLDVSISSMEDLFDGLLDTDHDESKSSSPESSLLVSPKSKESSSVNLEEESPHPSIMSPEMSPISTHAADDAPFLSNTKTNIVTKLTPTKLNRSPRRVLNSELVDSPARNTRSHSKKAQLSNQSTNGEILRSSAKNDDRFKTTPTKLNRPPKRVMNPEVIFSPDTSTQITSLSCRAKSGDIKRKRDSIDSSFSALSPSHDKRTSLGSRSKLAVTGNGSIPRGILTSAKKITAPPDSLSRKSVVFGSPEAAEYRIGSPSINLTPMPANQAKRLFSIPDALRSDVESSPSESTIEDETIEIELNMSDLLKNTGVIENTSDKSDQSTSKDKLNNESINDEGDIEVNLDDKLRIAEKDLSDAKHSNGDATKYSQDNESLDAGSISTEAIILGKSSESNVASTILVDSSNNNAEKESASEMKTASLVTLEEAPVAKATPISSTENDSKDDWIQSSCISNSPLGVLISKTLSSEVKNKNVSPISSGEKISPSNRRASQSDLNIHGDQEESQEIKENEVIPRPMNKKDESFQDYNGTKVQLQTASDCGETVELEGNLSSVLKATDSIVGSSSVVTEITNASEDEIDDAQKCSLKHGKTENGQPNDNTLGDENQSPLITKKTETMESIKNISSTEKSFLPIDNSPMEENLKIGREKDDTNTIELETTMSSLLKVASNDDTSEVEPVSASTKEDDAMDFTETMPSSLKLRSNSSPISETLEIDVEKEETKTIELERTMFSLLKASSEDSNPEPNSASAKESPSQAVNASEEASLQSSTSTSIDSPIYSSKPHVDTVSEDETIELETDLSAILALATQRNENTGPLPALKLTDKFPTMASGLAPQTNRMSFGYPISNNSVSKDDTLPLDFMASPISQINDRKSLGSHRKSIGSQSRFSLRKRSRLSISSTGDITVNSESESDVLIGDDEDSTNAPLKGTDQIMQSFDVANHEIVQLINSYDGTIEKNRIEMFENSILSFCAKKNIVNSTISESIRSFAAAVCGEVEEKVIVSSDSEACYATFLDSISDNKMKFQSWLRSDANKIEIQQISHSIKGIVQHEWLTWEKMVADSLLTAIDQIADEYVAEDDNLTNYAELLEEINEAINTQKGKAAQRAKQRTMANHKVSNSLYWHNFTKGLSLCLIPLFSRKNLRN